VSCLSRRFLSLVGLVVGALIAQASPPTDHKPTPADLVRDLGNPSYAIREKASQELWKRGPAALAALREAARSSDTEVRTRANAILEKFEWGIFPDTPAEVLRQIREFQSGERDRQLQALTELLRLDTPGLVTLRVILSRHYEADLRQQLFVHLAERLRVIVPPAIVANELDRAESLLELNTLGPADAGISDYILFMMLQNRLAAAIEKLEAARDKPGMAADAAAKGLVYAYRLAGDNQKAREAAAAIRDQAEVTAIVEALLEDQGAWSELAQLPLDDSVQSRVGLKMFRHRMAGNTKEVDELATIAKNAVRDDGLHSGEVYEAALALLLNGRSLDGIELLKARRAQPHMLADVLSARLEFQEALALIGRGEAADAVDATNDPRFRNFYATRKARLLAQLGRADDAKQLFNQTAASLRDRDQYTIQQLLRAEVRAGQFELAAEHAARFLHIFDQTGQGFYIRPGPFEILFEEDADAAQGWWVALRAHGPRGETPVQTMKRVRELMKGNASPEQFAEAMRVMEVVTGSVRETDAIRRRFGPLPITAYHQARAAAYRATGQTTTLEKYLVQAAESVGLNNLDEDWFTGSGPRAWVYGTDERYRPWLDLGDFLADAGRYVEAAQRYEQGWQRFPDNPILLYLSGWALMKSGNEKEGKQRMEWAHWVPLGNARMRGRFLEELYARGHVTAVKRERDLTRHAVWYGEPYRGNIWNQIGRASILLKDFDTAAAASERSLHYILRTTGVTFVEGAAYVTVPTGVKVLQARSQMASGEADKAIALIREVQAILPGHIESVTTLVPELDKLGRKTEADRLFRSVWDVYQTFAKDYPQSAWAHNGAAAVAAGCRRELDTALIHAKQAVELEPEMKTYKETLAEIHFRLGDREQALTIMHDLSKTDWRNPLYKRQLARYKSGDINSPIPLTAE
jgi:tetratricopeptide (TPR) repeat protein